MSSRIVKLLGQAAIVLALWTTAAQADNPNPLLLVGGHFSPTTMSGLTGWWDFSDTSTITQAIAAISQINDKSGHGYNFTQAAGTNKPLLSRTDNAENQILQSENLQTTWLINRASATSATALVNDSTASSTHYISQPFSVLPGSYNVGVSLARSVGTMNARLYIQTAGGNAFVSIDLSNGNLSGISSTAAAWTSGPTATVDGSYYRITGTVSIPTIDAAALFQVYMADSGLNTTYNGDSTASILITKTLWQKASASEYVTTTTYPQYAGRNGCSIAVFDGTDDYMTSTAIMSQIFAAQNKTLIVSFTPNVLNVWQELFSPSDGSAPNLRIYNSSSYLNWIDNDGGAKSIVKVTTAGAAQIITVTHDSTNINLGVNGIFATPIACGASADLTKSLEIGAFGAGTQPFNGSINEILTFNRALTTQERVTVERYLGAKWGVSVL